MARTLPTEESLGLSPTEDELNTAVTSNDDDDISLDDDPVTEPEPVKAKQPEPEAAKEPEKDAEKPADDPKMVDVRAVQEARAEAREAKQRAAILEQRWNEFIASQQPKAAEPEKPAIPGPDDPMARVNWAAEQIAAMQEAQQKTAAEQAEQQRQQTAYQEAYSKVDAEYTAAMQTDPTLPEAYNALRKSQGEELLALGYTIPQAKAELDRIEREHVMYVTQRGISIAEHIKNLAAVRGWRPQAAATPAPAPKTDLAAVAAAQQRHQSLSDAPGGEGVAPLDAKALAKMSDKDFKAWMSKKGNEEKFDQLMGA
jgi:hypothetical protein